MLIEVSKFEKKLKFVEYCYLFDFFILQFTSNQIKKNQFQNSLVFYKHIDNENIDINEYF